MFLLQLGRQPASNKQNSSSMHQRMQAVYANAMHCLMICLTDQSCKPGIYHYTNKNRVIGPSDARSQSAVTLYKKEKAPPPQAAANQKKRCHFDEKLDFGTFVAGAW